jgi:hypothetical protein
MSYSRVSGRVTMASSFVDGATRGVLHLRLFVETLLLVGSHSGQDPKRVALIC